MKNFIVPLAFCFIANIAMVTAISTDSTQQIHSSLTTKNFSMLTAKDVKTIIRSAALAFSPLGDFIAVVSNSGILQIFGINSAGNLSNVISTHAAVSGSASVAWSPKWSPTTGGFVAVVDDGDGLIKTFKIGANGTILGEVGSRSTGKNQTAYKVAFSPTGDFIAVITWNTNILKKNIVRIFKVGKKGSLKQISSLPAGNFPYAVAWSPSWSDITGGYIAIVDNGEPSTRIFGVDTLGQLSAKSTTNYAGESVAWSPLGNFIATTEDADSIVQTFSVNPTGQVSATPASFQNIGPFPYTYNNPYKVSWSPSWSNVTGGYIAVIDIKDDSLLIFSVSSTGQLSLAIGPQTIEGLTTRDVAWSPLGNVIATVTQYGLNGATLKTFVIS